VQTPVQTSGLGSLTVRVYAFVSERMTDEALELFVDRKIAELMVKNWNRDEPDRAGELRVEPIDSTFAELRLAPPFGRKP